MILVVGSINMDISLRVADIPAPGETVMSSGIRKSPGGKGANQAVAAAKLGGDVVMLGCVGQDENGQALLKSLAEAGVDTTNIRQIPSAPTSSAFWNTATVWKTRRSSHCWNTSLPAIWRLHRRV